MKALTLISTLLFLYCSQVSAQSPTNRLKARYFITAEKLEQLNKKGVFISDGKVKDYKICGTTKLKVLITASGGILKLDPWKIIHDTSKNIIDPCRDQVGVINSNTPNTLYISLNRELVGETTHVINIPYRAWVLGINAIALKIRPRVRDYADNLYSSNAVGGNFSLGPSIGYSFGFTNFSHRGATSWSATPGLSLGFSTISLGKEPLKKQVVTTYTPSNFVLSPTLNLILARNDFGITFSYGKDAMMGRHKTAWAYQGKSFFGVGVATGLKL